MQTLFQSSASHRSRRASFRSRNKLLLGLAGWLLVSFAAGGIGAAATLDAARFYGHLNLPAWAPTAGVFGPVWSVLYALMGIAAWLVWKRSGAIDAYVALTLFFVQLALNALWCWFFFGWHRGGVAFADIVLLWIVVAAMLASFWQHNRMAAVILAPYLAWITFAAALNYAVWKLNPALLSGMY
jgi:tryptophan-rich sensory protein